MIAWYGLMGRGASVGQMLPKLRTAWVRGNLKGSSSWLDSVDSEGRDFLLSCDPPGHLHMTSTITVKAQRWGFTQRISLNQMAVHSWSFSAQVVLPWSGNSWGTCVRMNSTTMDWTRTSLKTAVPLNPDASMSFDLNARTTVIGVRSKNELDAFSCLNSVL